MAAYRKEQMLSLLDDLDADMEATKPIHWTVRKLSATHAKIPS